MGNCRSCIEVASQTATIIDQRGRLRQVNAPITVAEIMLDNPGHVISPESLIQKTVKITAMKADEELCPGRIYLLVPYSRVNSRVSESDMELMENACKRNKRTKRRRGKVLPTENKSLPTLSLGDRTGFESNRVSNSCPWRPALEPIFEEIGSFRVNFEMN